MIDVSSDQKAVVVTQKLPKRRRRVCSKCGQAGRHLEIADYRINALAAPTGTSSAARSHPIMLVDGHRIL